MPAAKQKKATVTDDVDDFLKNIRPGDVLLFDSMHMISQLIKFAENRPVNHCGIFLEDDHYAQMGSGKSFVHSDNLRRRLESKPGPYDRTVTALRHVDAFEGKEGKENRRAIVKTANEYIEHRKTTYSYVGLRHLMIPSLYRNYKKELAKHKVGGAVLDPLIKLLAKGILGHFEKGEAVRELSGTKSLTCSEFVYRCLVEAKPGLHVDVYQPLMRWNDELWRLSRPRPPRGDLADDASDAAAFAGPYAFGVAGDEEDDVLGPLLFDESMEPGLLKVSFNDVPREELSFVPAPAGPVDFGANADDGYDAMWGGFGHTGRGSATGGPGEGDVDLSAWSDGMFRDLARRNARRHKYDDVPEAARRDRAVFADSVTPRDLWSSSSLRPVAVFHCPPLRREDEPRLE